LNKVNDKTGYKANAASNDTIPAKVNLVRGDERRRSELREMKIEKGQLQSLKARV